MIAIVLAGGKGTRLAPWPAPKCLLPVNGVPMLVRQLKHLLESRSDRGLLIERAVVCAGYRAEDVAAAIEHSMFGAFEYDHNEILVSFAGEDVPMGARLLAARTAIIIDKDDSALGRTLICYGDELADVDIARLVAAHEHETMATMTFAVANQKIAGGHVTRNPVDNCPIIDEGAHTPVNIGFLVVEPECWWHLRPEDGLSDWINRESARGMVRTYRHYGKRATINSLADLRAAEEMWK